MICKNCGMEMPDGVKFCSNCGGAVSSEPAGVDVPAAFDPDATVIADHVAPSAPVAPVYQAPAAPVASAEPAAPVYQRPMDPASPAYQMPAEPVAPAYQAPVQPVTPTYQAPVVPAAPQKNGINVKLIAIIGGVVAVIVAIVLIIVFAGGNKDKGEEGDGEGSSVATVVKDYTEEEFYDFEFSNYKSEYKVSADGAYYQIFTADIEADGEKGYFVGGAWVYKNEVEELEYEYYSEDEMSESEFEEYVSELVLDEKEDEEYYKEELAEFAYYDEEYDY